MKTFISTCIVIWLLCYQGVEYFFDKNIVVNKLEAAVCNLEDSIFGNFENFEQSVHSEDHLLIKVEDLT